MFEFRIGCATDCCAQHGKKCGLQCLFLQKNVRRIKNLLDREARRNKMAVHPGENIAKALLEDRAITVLSVLGDVVSIVGFTYLIPWKNHVEIAGLVIRKNYRELGVGGKLFSRAIELAGNKYPQQQVIFFANDVSEKIGRKYGFWSAPYLLTDPESSELCKDCKKEYKKPGGCRCRAMILNK